MVAQQILLRLRHPSSILTHIPLPRYLQHGKPKQIYERISLPVESVELYKPHGYHPIIIGTTLDGGRYRVIRKLGQGSYSTVWLALDMQLEEIVVVKVAVADHVGKDDAHHEVSIYEHFDHAHQLRLADKFAHVVRLLRHFKESGPNAGLTCGHQCLVEEVMGPSCLAIVKQPRAYLGASHIPGAKHIPYWMAKSMIKHLVRGVHDLHTSGIVHGDIHAGNLLANIKPPTKAHAASLTQEVPNGSAQTALVKKKKGGRDKHAPEYLIAEEPLVAFANLDKSNVAFKLADIGGAFTATRQPSRVQTPGCMRSPEFVLGLDLSEKIDIWSIGCLIYYILTSRNLFPVDSSGDVDQQEAIDDAMTWQVDRLGSLPDSLAKRWKHKSKYYDSKWVKIRSDVESRDSDDSDEDMEVEEIFKADSLETAFRADRPHEMCADEAEQVLALLWGCLHYEPSKRLSAEQVINDVWIRAL